MFKKNDPLVDAVKSVMRESDLDRQAEAAVNEAFGVVSRKAIPHEHLAQYDALLDEAKKCMYQEADQGNATGPIIPNARPQAGVAPGPNASMISRPGSATGGPGAGAPRAPVTTSIQSLVNKTVKEEDNKKPLSPRQKEVMDLNKNNKIDPEDLKLKRAGLEEKWKEELEEDQLDEVSKDKLVRYASRATADAYKKGKRHGEHETYSDKNEAEKNMMKHWSHKGVKRVQGSDLAARKLAGKAKVNATEEANQLDEKAVSNAQHRFFRLVRGIQKGKAHGSEKAEKAAKEMSTTEVRKFAKTKEKGLPEKVEEQVTDMATYIRRRITEQSVFEEVRSNLEEELAYAYENLSEEDFAAYVGSLTEEQLAILGLNEAIGGTRAEQGAAPKGSSASASSGGSSPSSSGSSFFSKLFGGGDKSSGLNYNPDTSWTGSDKYKSPDFSKSSQNPASSGSDLQSKLPRSWAGFGPETTVGSGTGADPDAASREAAQKKTELDVKAGDPMKGMYKSYSTMSHLTTPSTPSKEVAAAPDLSGGRQSSSTGKSVDLPGISYVPRENKKGERIGGLVARIPAGAKFSGKNAKSGTGTTNAPDATSSTGQRGSGQGYYKGTSSNKASKSSGMTSAQQDFMSNFTRGMYEETKPQIKESFEQFLRNKFLKG